MEKNTHENYTDDIEISTFQIGNVRCGINILNIQEINKQTDITTVPHARNYIKGILNLRGNIVTVVDLAKRLGLSSSAETDSGRNIIVDIEGEHIGLFVDAIGDFIKASPGDVDPPPPNISKLDGKFFSGVLKSENDLIGLLDIEEVLKH